MGNAYTEQAYCSNKVSASITALNTSDWHDWEIHNLSHFSRLGKSLALSKAVLIPSKSVRLLTLSATMKPTGNTSASCGPNVACQTTLWLWNFNKA